MSWIANRLAEPSTRIGLGIVAALLTQVSQAPPTSSVGWLTLGMGALGGLAGIVTPAPGSPDAPAKAAP